MPGFWTEKVTAQGACMEEMHAVQDVARDPKIPLLSGYLVIFPNRLRSAVLGPLWPASPEGRRDGAEGRRASRFCFACGLRSRRRNVAGRLWAAMLLVRRGLA